MKRQIFISARQTAARCVAKKASFCPCRNSEKRNRGKNRKKNAAPEQEEEQGKRKFLFGHFTDTLAKIRQKPRKKPPRPHKGTQEKRNFYRLTPNCRPRKGERGDLRRGERGDLQRDERGDLQRDERGDLRRDERRVHAGAKGEICKGAKGEICKGTKGEIPI